MKNTTFILLLVSVLFTNAQMTPPKWEISTESNVKWMEVNDWGMLIASCTDAIYGINPLNGDKLWKVSGLTNVKKDDYSSIPDTPLIILEDGPLLKVVNGLTGETIIDSQQEGMEKVKDVRFIGELEGLLIEYKNGKVQGLSHYDLAGTSRWNQTFDLKSSSDLQAVPSPLTDNAGNLYYGIGSQLLKLNGTTGEVLWSSERKKGVRDFFLSPDQKTVIVVDGSVTDIFKNQNSRNTNIQTTTGGSGMGNFRIAGLDDQKGSESWLHAYKSKYAGVFTGPEDFVLFHWTSLNKISYSGEKSWSKEPKYVGSEQCLNLMELADGSLVYGTKGRFSNIYKISASGEKMWKKTPTFNGELYSLELAGDYLLHVTTAGANMIDMQTGKKLWTGDKFIGSGGLSVLLSYDNNGYPVLWSQSRLIRIIPEKQDWELVREKAAVVGVPQQLVTTDAGFRLSSEQNVFHIADDGSTIYNTYFPSPKQSFGSQMLLSMASISTSVVGLGVGLSSVNYQVSGALSDNKKDIAKGEAMANLFDVTMDGAGMLNALAVQRFKEQIEAPDYKLILTEKEGAIGLVKVNLKSGEEEGFIVTEDRTPEFVLDQIDDRLFFKSATQRISCYEF